MEKSRPDQPNDREAGTSLVELMFASLVVLIVVGAILSMAIRQSAQRGANVETSLALAAAVDALERSRALTEPELLALDGQGFDVLGQNGGAGGLSPQAKDADGLPGRFEVVVDQDYGGHKLHRVTVSIHWRGVSGSRALQLSALVGNRKQ